MSDINKKIELDVDSNVDKTTQEFNKLNKTIKDMLSNFNKLGKLSNLNTTVSGLKKVTKAVDDLNKSIFNLGGMNQLLDSINTKMKNITAATKKASKAAQDADAKKEVIKSRKKSIKLSDYNLLSSALDKTQAEKEKEAEEKLKQAKYTRMNIAAKNIAGAFGSMSALNIVSSILGAGTASVFGKLSDDYGKKFLARYTAIDRDIVKQEKIKASPESTKAQKDAAELKIKRDKTRRKQLEDKENKFNTYMARRAKFVESIINITIKSLRGFSNVIKSTTGVTLSLKENFTNLINGIGSTLSMQSGAATFASGSTLYTNAAARTQQMKYGLTNAQNYALSRTMGMLGMTTDEDLMYMNKSQQRLFSSLMEKYSNWYNRMESSGVLKNVQEMQMDLQIFKEELVMDFMQWFSENKDDIVNSVKTIAKFVMQIASVVAKGIGWVGKSISWMTGQNSSAVSDTMSTAASYSNATISASPVKTNTINITMTNNATGVLSDQSQMEAFFKDQIAQVSRELEANFVK